MRIGYRFPLIVAAGMFCASVGTARASAGPGHGQDTVTIDGLEWTLTANGRDIRWPQAVEYCAGLELAGHGDWRLPTLDELESLHDPDGSHGIRGPISMATCCLWSGESLVDRPAEDGDEIGGSPEMYHWGFMFDGGLRYYAVNIYDDGQALCVRDIE